VTIAGTATLPEPRRAIAIYSMMVGALQLSRAVNDKRLSEEILDGAIDAALALAGED